MSVMILSAAINRQPKKNVALTERTLIISFNKKLGAKVVTGLVNSTAHEALKLFF